jgi:hypothetical protein
MANAAHFRKRTKAILVGQPIGEKPNSYQEAREMVLPNSRWVARYSVRFYRFVRGEENLIRPDREIAETWADFQAGRDPVMNSVLRSISDAQKFEVRNPLRIWSDQRFRLLERLDVSRFGNISSETKTTRRNVLLFPYQLREKIDLYLSQ